MTIGRLDQAAMGAAPKVTPKKSEKKESAPAQLKDSISIGQKEDQEPAAPQKKWTIMHYSAADNNLTSYLETDVNEMEKVGSTQNMNIVVQLDKGKDDCKRYYLKPDGNMDEITSPIIKDLGSTNMADPKVMGNFIGETMKKYPAEHYALIISDHGYGWKGAVEDESHHGWMTTPDIRKGIELGEEAAEKKIDLIGFDACLMATSEVGYELKDTASYLVASEQTERANGWPYTPLLTPKLLKNLDKALSSKLNISPKEFAKKIVDVAEGDQYYLPTMSATDLSKMRDLGKAADNFAKAILKTETPNDMLKSIIRETEDFQGFKDQYHFAEQVANHEEITDEKLKESAKGMMAAIKSAVIAEQHAEYHINAHGLTAEIPDYGGVGEGYGALKFRADTKWGEAINKIQDAGEPRPYPEPDKKKWTILHYTAGDNNLAYYLFSDVNEMEVVGSNDDMNLVVQFDRGGSNCKRYYLEQDGDMRAINSPVLKDMGRTNMADPKVMADFIKFGVKNYPADHYALIIGDHGEGWKGAVSDGTHSGWMSTPDIQNGLQMAQDETGVKMDILGFDACLMANTEVGYELKDNANYMVASEEVEGGSGWPYTPLLTSETLKNVQRALRQRINLSPEDFAKKMITNAEGDQYSIPTLSATDLTKMESFAKVADTFAKAIINTETPNDTLNSLACKTEDFYGLKDHYHFAELVSKSDDISDEKLKDAAKGMMAAIKDAVIKEQHSSKYPNAHGLTAEIPTYGEVGNGYTDLKFARDTKWDEAMNKINQ
ncbi:MAG: hypothetical protein K8T10_02295 [Candidatus Eremiobacteraeota bacterium]|nr:hypothetical protein [Candidatus Eremiobacteraeota bacterium]